MLATTTTQRGTTKATEKQSMTMTEDLICNTSAGSESVRLGKQNEQGAVRIRKRKQGSDEG